MKVKVSIKLVTGQYWKDCEIFLNDMQRLSDVVNDPREFLPIQRRKATGKFEQYDVILHKSQVAFVTEEEMQ